MTSVTGFSLFTLCHYFGRRGRAMARSLAQQVGCTVPLRLTVFYSRSEDVRLLFDGIDDGPSPPGFRTVQLPTERIMQRAMHFSEAHRMHDLSHSVFFDSDLWFPPTFWAKYAEAVDAETTGYWSCRVMDVPLPAAEAYVDHWTAITPERLDQVAKVRRLDHQAGKAGHFQCIPRDLVPYPANPIQSVVHADLAFSSAAIERSVDRRTERRISRVPAYHFDHPRCWEGTGGLQL